MTPEISIDATAPFSSVSEALRAVKGSKPRVVAITNSFERIVSLPAAQAKKLGRQALAKALYYEIEPFGALPETDGTMGFVQIPSHDAAEISWRVAQVPKSLIEGTIQSAKDNGVAIAQIKTASGVELWRKEGALKHHLSANFCLVILLAALAGALFLDWQNISGSLHSIERSVETRTALEMRLSAERTRARTALSEMEALAAERDSSLQSQKRAAMMRRSLARFLSAAGTCLRHGAVVRSIEPLGNGISMRINAIAVSADEAAKCATRLDETLTPLGWKVSVENISPLAGTSAFSCIAEFIGGEVDDD